MEAKFDYDYEGDSFYISPKSRKPSNYKVSECLDDNLILDLNHNNEVIGVEVLFISEYFNIPKSHLKNIKKVSFKIDIKKDKILINVSMKFNLRNKLNEKDLFFERINSEMLSPSLANLAAI